MNENKVKGGFVITVIGRQQSGKTPVIKGLIKKINFRRKAVLDIEYEYDPEEFKIFRDPTNYKHFILFCRKYLLVTEEATTFVEASRDLNLTTVCTQIAHRHNIIIFVFHSLMDAPKSILNKSKYIHLLPTLDDEKDVKNSRNRYYKLFLKVRKLRRGVWLNNYNL